MSEYTKSDGSEKALQDQLRRLTPAKLEKNSINAALRTFFYRRGVDITPRAEILRGQLSRLEDCGSYVNFHDYFRKNRLNLVSANFCRNHTLCPFCSIRRANKNAKKLYRKAQKLMNERPDLKGYFITFTVKNKPVLDDALRKLRTKGLKTKMKNAKRAKSTQNPEKSKFASALNSQFANVVAGAYSIETTWSKKMDWHPHMHGLFFSETPITQGKLREEWKEYTSDSFIVDVQEIEVTKKDVSEIMKYSLQFSKMPAKKIIEAYLSLKGRRLTSSCGDFYGMDLDPDPADVELEGEPFIETLMNFYNDSYHKLSCRVVDKRRTDSVIPNLNMVPYNPAN